VQGKPLGRSITAAAEVVDSKAIISPNFFCEDKPLGLLILAR
jgi:hypothetical protein